jgi:hypothetical protein
MSDTTTRRGISQPSGDRSDSADVPLFIRNVAAAVDNDVIYFESTIALRGSATLSGRIHRATDTGDLSFDTGTTWIAFGAVADLSITAAKLAPISLNTITNADYTLVIGDRFKTILMTSSSAHTLTVPTNAAPAFNIGDSIDIVQMGTGQVTIAGSGGVTIDGNPGLKIVGQYVMVSLLKIATDTWLVVGGLTS